LGEKRKKPGFYDNLSFFIPDLGEKRKKRVSMIIVVFIPDLGEKPGFWSPWLQRKKPGFYENCHFFSQIWERNPVSGLVG
jgi:hypothetical protein